MLFYAILMVPLALVLLLHLALNSFGITTWEMMQMRRGRPVPYLLDEKGGFRNPYDRGFLSP